MAAFAQGSTTVDFGLANQTTMFAGHHVNYYNPAKKLEVTDDSINTEEEVVSIVESEAQTVQVVTRAQLLLSPGTAFAATLSITSLVLFGIFTVGLFRPTFLDPRFALFSSICAGFLAFEAMYSRKYVRKNVQSSEKSRK